jgi:hypothetical protein
MFPNLKYLLEGSMLKYHLIHQKFGRLFYFIVTALIIVSFLVPFSTNKAYALNVPQLIYPEDNSDTTSVTDPPLGVPSFAWTAVTGANSYRIQVDSEIGFNSPIFLDLTTMNSTFTPLSTGNLFSDGEWYWRVRVEDPAPVGDWSPIFRFTKTWATPDNRPNLLAPAEGALLAFYDYPDFTWTRVMGAAKYRFQIANTPNGFDTPKLSVDTLSTSYQPKDNRLANSTYYWRVIPMDTADYLGTPSSVQSFVAAYGSALLNDMVPTLKTPADESFPTFTPTFHWTAIKGAQLYRLEYTSDETCDFSVGTSLQTRQTYYTPTDTFPNDFRYCWHVRVESDPAVGNWSETWHFQKTWALKPTLLTPTNLYQTGLYPLYSWTPVPGASRYQIQIATNPSFEPIFEERITANTTYTPQQRYDGTAHYYWRVRPIDGGGEYGVSSDVGEFQSIYNSEAPILIYPLYYYQPNNYGSITLNPYEDRTVAFPIFMWHRVMTPSPVGGVFANAYRIQVDDSPYFDTINWQYDTENTSATPTFSEGFSPTPDQNYYWRVCPLDGMDGQCLLNSESGLPWWSQVWIARFNPNLQLAPTNGDFPELLRPDVGQESVEATPLLEWWPFEGATQYQVQVSRDEDFSSTEITETVNIPSYSPKFSIAQRSLGRTDYGTFYWHVRGYTAVGWSDWSSVSRFQIAAQSEWRYVRSLGNDENKLLIGDDPSGDATAGYDLTTLFASQSDSDWYLGFNADISTVDMTYVFYLDLNNVDGSGATAPPERNYQVYTNSEHQPEYVIYVDVMGGIIDTQHTWVYAWNGSEWGSGQKFADIGGAVYASNGYVELKIPNGAIGMSQETGRASVMLFSVDTSTGVLQDTVPSDPQVPGTYSLSHFSAVSERMNLIYPPNTASGDPTTVTSLKPFYWDWPTGSNGATPFAGSVLQVDLDQNYSPPHEATFEIDSNTSYFSENNVSLLADIVGDNIYYWRVQPRYLLEGFPEAFGAWTGGWSFRRQGFTAENLYTSTITSTLSFGWDMAEGADGYKLQVATDPNFGNRVIDLFTPMNSYTTVDTLPQNLYYWRVQIVRYNNLGNDWTEGQPFEFTLPTPDGLTPTNGQVIHYAPNYCWDPLVLYDDSGDAVFTAWKYHLQVSSDPNFSNTYESIDTYNNCWTPTNQYKDGTYYWRVAIYDGNNRMGPYSLAATFTKQYPVTTLVSPISGSVPSTPTFIWTPVDGAATYVIEVSWFSTFSPLYDSKETINIKYTPTNIYTSDKVYYWRVAIKDRNGNQGPFTDARIIVGDVYPTFLPQIRR